MQPKTQRKHNAARLFFICCLIEYIARQTKNLRSDVVNALGKRKIKLIFDSSSGWYCFDNMEQVCAELIGECRIAEGHFDNVGDCRYPVPTYWEIGKVYQKLIQKVTDITQGDLFEVLIKVYHSFISRKIDDYNSGAYLENTVYLLECFLKNRII